MTILIRFLVVAFCVAAAAMAAAQPADTPDPTQMAGIPLAVDDLAQGTVSVRLVRRTTTNPVSDATIDFQINGRRQTVRTNSDGRAVVRGLKAGAAVQVFSTIDGEQLVSQQFAVPPKGGTRLLLVATAGSAGMAGDAMPLLATVATESSALPAPTQMAGVPLQVGDLPPGIVSVRLVRVAFANKIANHEIELHVGPGDEVRRGVTDAEGRAQFDGLAVGTEVHAYTIVDGEKLESQRFQLPAQGGVRVLLVAGTVPGAPAASHRSTSTTGGNPSRVRPIAGAAAVVLAGGLVIVGWKRRTRNRGSSRPRISSPDRDALFDELIALERRYESGQLPAATFATERERLFIALERASA